MNIKKRFTEQLINGELINDGVPYQFNEGGTVAMPFDGLILESSRRRHQEYGEWSAHFAWEGKRLISVPLQSQLAFGTGYIHIAGFKGTVGCKIEAG